MNMYEDICSISAHVMGEGWLVVAGRCGWNELWVLELSGWGESWKNLKVDPFD